MTVAETEEPPQQGQGAAPGRLLLSAAAWTAAEMRARQAEWATDLSPEEVAELEAAADAALAAGRPLEELTDAAAFFPLPRLAPRLAAARAAAVAGRGFALLRGLPVGRWSRRRAVAAYWVVGLHWGSARSNNARGHLVGHITDTGADPAAPETRLYATAAAQPFHNDGPADLVALLCLSPAAAGGTSSWASSVSVHNALLAARPDLAALLAQPVWYWDRKGEVPAGRKPYFCLPVFNFHNGFLSTNHSKNYYEDAQRHAAVPRLTAAQREAAALVDALAASDALRLDFDLQPGDIQLLSNHTVLHARAGFTDGPGAKRHLLRLWLSPEEERELPEGYAEIMTDSAGDLTPGARGGVAPAAGVKLRVPLEPWD